MGTIQMIILVVEFYASIECYGYSNEPLRLEVWDLLWPVLPQGSKFSVS